jgi:hypothetical protein
MGQSGDRSDLGSISNQNTEPFFNGWYTPHNEMKYGSSTWHMVTLKNHEFV